MNGLPETTNLEAVKRHMLTQILSKPARERLGRVRVANPVLAAQLEIYLIRLYQTGKLTQTVTDTKLKQILSLFIKEKRPTRIRRK
jgi:programmed cell death protein 5